MWIYGITVSLEGIGNIQYTYIYDVFIYNKAMCLSIYDTILNSPYVHIYVE